MVPLSTGEHVIPQFIRRLGTGEVEMVVGQEGNKAIYIAQLILKPDCSLPATEPITLWFSDLLTSPGDKFDTLTKAAYKLDNWAAHTEIMRYRHIDTECHKIELKLAILQAHLALNNKALNRCRFHIEASRVPHQLCNLQGRSDFPSCHGEQISRRAEGHPCSTGPGVLV